jgi:phosphinothricin acetyltransferase
MMLRPADAADAPAVEALLRARGLPALGVAQRLEAGLLAESGADVIGFAEVELHGAIGLLRCVAIHPSRQGAGLGKQLAGAVEAFARASGVRELCLLTPTAVPFFGGRGYRVDNRADAPPAIQGSPAFLATTAESAVFMTLRLASDERLAAPIRPATPDDAAAILDIYGPIVRHTAISFEDEPPGVDEMRERIARTLAELPWLVSVDERGVVNGFAYADRHRERAAYRWAVDVTAYVRQGSREQGVGRRLCEELMRQLVQLGYCQAFSRIALPNEAGIRLHEALGFEPLGVFRKVGFKNGAWRDVSWWQRQLRELPAQPAEPTRPAPPRASVSRAGAHGVAPMA